MTPKPNTPDRHPSGSSTDSAATADSISPVLSAGAGAPTGYFAGAPVAEPQTSPSLFGRLRRTRSRSPSARHPHPHPSAPHSPALGSPREPQRHPAHSHTAPVAPRSRPQALHARSTSAGYPAGGPTSAPTTGGAGSSMASVMGSGGGAGGAPRARSRSGCTTKRHSGTTMQVGRHSNDWLFGGFSITEKVRGMWSPSDEGPRD